MLGATGWCVLVHSPSAGRTQRNATGRNDKSFSFSLAHERACDQLSQLALFS